MLISVCKKTGSILKNSNIWCRIFGNSVIQVIGFKATHGAKYPIFLNLLIYHNYLLFPNGIVSFLTTLPLFLQTLLNQHHLPCLHKITGYYAVDISTAGQVRSIKGYFITPGILLFRNYYRNQPPEHIIDLKSN